MRLISYVRVSSEEQARGGVSLGMQAERLTAYATAHGHEVVAAAEDKGVSGRGPLSGRPGLVDALARIERGEAEGLVALKLDRISRNVVAMLDLAKRAKKNGWHLMSVSEHIDTSSAAGRFTLGVLALLAEMESDQIGERVSISLAHIAAQNRVTSFHTPFGWRLPDGSSRPPKRQRDKDDNATGDAERRTMVEHEGEQSILRAMLDGRARGMTLYAIAKDLNQRGLHNPRSGKIWHQGSIQSILRTAAKRGIA